MKVPSFDISIIVMGVHRSGTSALTRVIGLHGFNMPATLLAGNEKNEGGFWESPKINSFNNELLDCFKQSWFSIDPIDPSTMSAALQGEFLARGRQLLESEYGAAQSVVIKDPRSCRTGWFWLDLLKHMSRRVVVPISVRNPVEVAGSLEVRNGFDPEFGQLVWLRNYLDAEFFSRGTQRTFLGYDALLDDWRGVVRQLSEDLDLSLHLGKREEAELDSYLNADLRHHRVDHKAVLERVGCNPWVATAYEIFDGAGRGKGIGRAEQAELDAIKRAFDVAIPAFSQLVSSARLERKKADGLRERTTQIKQELGEARRVGDDLKALRRQAEAQSKAMERLNVAWKQEIGGLRAEVERARSIEKTVNAEKAAALAQLEVAERRVYELGDRLDRQLQANGQSQGEIRRLTAISDQFGKQRDELVSLKTRHQELADKYSKIKKKHQIQSQELRNGALTVARVRQEMSRMERAWPWRLHLLMTSILNAASFGMLRAGWQKKRQLRRHVDAIRDSGLFDMDWYRARYADVSESGVDPLLHYVSNGWREGRDPSAHFSSRTYLQHNPDVAVAGIDPLKHYLEHGRAEGRGPISMEWPASSPAAVVDVSFERAPSHPVYQGTAPTWQPSSIWRRWNDIAESEAGGILSLGKVPLALNAQEPSALWQEQVDDLFALFRMLSGEGGYESHLKPTTGPYLLAAGNFIELGDAWFLNDFSLRARWKLDHAHAGTIVRGFQFSPDAAEYKFLGEAPVWHSLDYVDFDLINPLYPVLVVTCDLQGYATSLALLPFPSIFRGGLHYAELVAAHQEGAHGLNHPLDIRCFTEELVDRVAKLKNGESSALVSAVRVDVQEADGSEPLFAEHVQQWLVHCMGLKLETGFSDASRGRAVNDYLSTRLAGKPHTGLGPLLQREQGMVLMVAAGDMPSLRLVLAGKSARADTTPLLKAPIAAPFIIADRDTALPKVLVSQPLETPQVIGGLTLAGSGSAAPSCHATDGGAVHALPFAATVRLKDAGAHSLPRLLTPVASNVYPLVKGGGDVHRVLVVARPNCFRSDGFQRTLETLRSQIGVQAFSIILAAKEADIPRSALDACDATFPTAYAIGGPDGAVDGEDLVLSLEADIIFHDRRIVHVLAGLLVAPAIASASCVLFHGQEGKKGWSAGGSFAGYVSCRRFGEDEGLLPLTNVDWLDRSVYPIVAPSSLLWMARRNDLDPLTLSAAVSEGGQQQVYPPCKDGQYHVCTTLMSATLPSDDLMAQLCTQPLRAMNAANGTRFSILRG